MNKKAKVTTGKSEKKRKAESDIKRFLEKINTPAFAEKKKAAMDDLFIYGQCVIKP